MLQKGSTVNYMHIVKEDFVVYLVFFYVCYITPLNMFFFLPKMDHRDTRCNKLTNETFTIYKNETFAL